MINVRTDLVLEAREIYKENHKNETDIDGIEVIEECEKDINVTTVKVKNQEGAEKIGKPKGNYITIDMPEFTAYDGETMDRVSLVVSEVLGRLINNDVKNTALIVGLGNWQVTPDALGPKVTEKIMITRHLQTVMPEVIDDSVRPVSSISPGVLGITGIETVSHVFCCPFLHSISASTGLFGKLLSSRCSRSIIMGFDSSATVSIAAKPIISSGLLYSSSTAPALLL